MPFQRFNRIKFPIIQIKIFASLINSNKIGENLKHVGR